jgi:hypothetical protein
MSGKNKIVSVIWIIREDETIEAKESVVGNRTIVNENLFRYVKVED